MANILACPEKPEERKRRIDNMTEEDRSRIPVPPFKHVEPVQVEHVKKSVAQKPEAVQVAAV